LGQGPGKRHGKCRLRAPVDGNSYKRDDQEGERYRATIGQLGQA